MNNLKFYLALLFLSFLAVAKAQDQGQRVVTYEKVQDMITNDGWIEKNPITAPNMKKAMNKVAVVNHIYIQNTATIIATADNQLVPYVDLLKPTGGIKAVYRTSGGFPVQNQVNQGVPSIPMLFNGFYDIPIQGDLIFTADDVPYDPAPETAGGSYQIYPGQDQKVNLLSDNGVVTWFGWVSDGTQMPTSLSATNLAVTSFTFSFQAGTEKECPRYLIEWDPWPLGSDQGDRQNYEFIENTQTAPGTITRNYTSVQDATWWCTCLPTSSGNYTDWEKEATLAVDLPESYLWPVFNTGSLIDGCAAGSSQPVYAGVDLTAGTPSGTLLYTDANLTIPYSNGGTTYFNTGGSPGSFYFVVNNDRTSGTISTCP